MTLIAIDGRNFGSNLNFVGRLTSIRLGLVERYRRWLRHRTTMAELRQYSDSELVELGISRYDIEDVAHGSDALQSRTCSSSHHQRRT
jgi:uncharacterized protein YjiS (DUF1127 family)